VDRCCGSGLAYGDEVFEEDGDNGVRVLVGAGRRSGTASGGL